MNCSANELRDFAKCHAPRERFSYFAEREWRHFVKLGLLRRHWLELRDRHRPSHWLGLRDRHRPSHGDWPNKARSAKVDETVRSAETFQKLNCQGQVEDNQISQPQASCQWQRHTSSILLRAELDSARDAVGRQCYPYFTALCVCTAAPGPALMVVWDAVPRPCPSAGEQSWLLLYHSLEKNRQNQHY